MARSGLPATPVRGGGAGGCAGAPALTGADLADRTVIAPACACAACAGRKLRAETTVAAAAAARASAATRRADLRRRSGAGNSPRRCLCGWPASASAAGLDGFRCWPEFLGTACLLIGRDHGRSSRHRLLATPTARPAAHGCWRDQGREVTYCDTSHTLGAVETPRCTGVGRGAARIAKHGLRRVAAALWRLSPISPPWSSASCGCHGDSGGRWKRHCACPKFLDVILEETLGIWLLRLIKVLLPRCAAGSCCTFRRMHVRLSGRDSVPLLVTRSPSLRLGQRGCHPVT